jgi:hypothetical protein
MQLSKETIRLLYNEIDEIVCHCDLSETQFDELFGFMKLLNKLFYGEPLEVTLADE